MNTETVAGGKVVNGEEDDEEKPLRLFGNIVFDDIFYDFLDFRMHSANNHLLERGSMQAACVGDRVTIVLAQSE